MFNIEEVAGLDWVGRVIESLECHFNTDLILRM